MQRPPLIVRGLGVPGPALQCAAVAGDRVFQPTGSLQRIAEIVVGLGVAGIELQGASKTGRRVVRVVERQKHGAEAVVEGRLSILDTNRGGNQFVCPMMVATLMGDQARQMQGIGMVGIGPKNPIVESRGLVQASLLMEAHRINQKLVCPRRRDSACFARGSCLLTSLPTVQDVTSPFVLAPANLPDGAGGAKQY